MLNCINLPRMLYISNARVGDNVNNTTLELQQDLARSTPKQCVTLTHSVPSVQMYYALKTKLEACTDAWLKEFLHLDGLDSLLEALSQMSGHGFTCFSDAILQIDCLSCIRCVLNTNTGLEHFITNDVYTKKLSSALTSSETLPKRHVFEILSALCVYSQIGYLRVLEGLSHVKCEGDQLHRFSIVVQDLQKSENVAHKMAVLTFINTLINCTPDITERIRIRNEFIGLNLLDVLSYLRRTETDEGIQLQLEIFHERKVSDEESLNAENDFDFNSPQDLLDLIQSKVFGTPRMVNFVNILQDLLSIETVHTEQSGRLWQTLDSLLHHIVHTMNRQGVDDIQSIINKLPDQVGSLLNCLSSFFNNIKQQNMQGSNNSLSSVDNINGNPKCVEGNVPNLLSQRNLSKDLNSRKHLKFDESGSSLANRGDTGSKSSLNSDNTSHNKTVILKRHITQDNSARSNFSCVNDVTMVIKSDRNTSLQSDGASICSSSGNETSSSQDRLTGQNTSSFDNYDHNPVTSTTFNISDEDNVNGINYNTSKHKLYNYNQNKVGSKLGFQCDVLEEESLSFDECYNTMMDGGQNVDKPGELQNNIEVSVVSDGSRDIKHVNKIEREEITAPTRDLVNLRWITLSDEAIVGRDPCLWIPSVCDNEKFMVDVNYLEQAFHVQTPQKSQAVEEVVLLNANTRLRINLFLSRLDCGAEDLVQNLEEGNKLKLTLPMLKYMKKVLPCEEEITMLQSYTGPRLELGMAEQFALLLSGIPDYTVLLDGLLVQAEFDDMVTRCKSSLSAMMDMSRVILKSQPLKRLCHLVLQIGNTLNYGSYNGDASGFKMTTFQQLTDVKAVIPYKNLLHHVVQIVMDQDKQVLDFTKHILPLETAASCSMEEIKTEISKLNNKLQCFMVNLSRSNSKLQNMFHIFIENLKVEFKEIQQLTLDLRTLTDDLAEYFCEDLSRFNLQQCFQSIFTFCKEINTCHADMICMAKIQRPNNKTGDILQKRLKNKLMSLEFGQKAGASSSMVEDKVKVLEKMLGQLHKGNFNPCTKTDDISPDQDTAHPLEMSCIPHEGSPLQLRQTLAANLTDNVFLETPELVCAGYQCEGSGGMTRSSTQRIIPITETCTAQTALNNGRLNKPDQATKHLQTSSPIRADKPDVVRSCTLQRKLFPKGEWNENGYRERKIDVEGCQPTQRPKRQLELPGRRGNHCRSRSDLTDSICITNKWIEYEKMRSLDRDENNKAPIAEPESTCNLSILNLETNGKNIHNPNHGIKKGKGTVDPAAPTSSQPFDRFNKNRKSKTSVGGFFSRIGRAVLKPRNVYSDGDESENVGQKIVKSTSSDKENVYAHPPENERFGLRGSKRYKTDQSGSKVSRFFNRGGLYRSSKMKKRQQQEQNV